VYEPGLLPTFRVGSRIADCIETTTSADPHSKLQAADTVGCPVGCLYSLSTSHYPPVVPRHSYSLVCPIR